MRVAHPVGRVVLDQLVGEEGQHRWNPPTIERLMLVIGRQRRVEGHHRPFPPRDRVVSPGGVRQAEEELQGMTRPFGLDWLKHAFEHPDELNLWRFAALLRWTRYTRKRQQARELFRVEGTRPGASVLHLQ